MPIHRRAIESLLTTWESRQLVAYVPCRPRNYTGQGDYAGYTPFGVSGVTVATGLDLG